MTFDSEAAVIRSFSSTGTEYLPLLLLFPLSSAHLPDVRAHRISGDAPSVWMLSAHSFLPVTARVRIGSAVYPHGDLSVGYRSPANVFFADTSRGNPAARRAGLKKH
jgi:hypothetical protein